MTERQVAFVQFPHPGGEHDSVEVGFCPWNRGDRQTIGILHRRKFLVSRGRYLSGETSGEEEVGFWGEWEAPSIMHPTRRARGEPRCLHVPAFYQPDEYDELLDTDPFVFGGRFLYTACRQHTHHLYPGGARETALKHLGRGSVIVFGSCIRRRFAVDTVIVVGNSVEYANGDFLPLADLSLPDEYYDVTLNAASAMNPTVASFRLYLGATVEEPVDGMFSYVPCMPTRLAPRGFPRPQIELPGLVTQNLSQGAKVTQMRRPDLIEAWGEVRKQIEDAGLSLAHHIDLDPVRLKRNRSDG